MLLVQPQKYRLSKMIFFSLFFSMVMLCDCEARVGANARSHRACHKGYRSALKDTPIVNMFLKLISSLLFRVRTILQNSIGTIYFSKVGLWFS